PDESIPIHLIKIGKTRGRKNFKNILDLRDSIKKHGLINPITVSRKPDGTYLLIAGECRLLAAIKIPWTKVPCYIKENLNAMQEKELELEENLQRTNLSPYEECDLMEQIDTLKKEIHGHKTPGRGGKEEGWGIGDTAKLTNRSIGQASQQINFAKKLKARPDVADRVKKLPLKHAMKEFDRILEAERLERLRDAGHLEVSLDFRFGDAKVLMQTIEDSTVDLVVWDPPYGIDELEKTTSDTKSGKMKAADNLSQKDAIDLMVELLMEVERVLKPGAHFYIFFSFNNLNDLEKNLTIVGLEFSDVPIIWDKQTSTTIFKGYNFMSGYEPILYGWKPPRGKRLSKSCKNIIQCKGVPKKEKLHAFEKPVELLANLIKLSSNLNDIVLDPTAGSGSTLSAAMQTGRRPIGFEIDKEHYLRALVRLQEEQEEIKGAADG
ncbi:hypothetical protein LCGC14_2303330, partial [marine sediment metagenome]